MTDTIDVVAADPVERAPAAPGIDEQSVAERLVAQARKKGIELVGPDRLLSQLTKRFLETALEAEMSDHLGYDKHDPVGRNSGNSRNGMRSKTVLTEIGPVEIEVPRDIDASFQPQIVRKRQRRSTGVDQIVLSLSARGLTNARRCSHQPEVQVADSQIGPQAAELQGPERARNPDKANANRDPGRAAARRHTPSGAQRENQTLAAKGARCSHYARYARQMRAFVSRIAAALVAAILCARGKGFGWMQPNAPSGESSF